MKPNHFFILLLFIPSLAFGQVASNTLDPFFSSKSAAASSWRDGSILSIGIDDLSGEVSREGQTLDDTNVSTFSALAAYKGDGFGIEAAAIDKTIDTEGVMESTHRRNTHQSYVPAYLHLMFSENLSFGIESIRSSLTDEDRINISGDEIRTTESEIVKTGISLGIRLWENLYISTGLRNIKSEGSYRQEHWDASQDIERTEKPSNFWQERYYGFALKTGKAGGTRFHLETYKIYSAEAKKEQDVGNPVQTANHHPKTEETGYSVEAMFGEFLLGVHNSKETKQALSFDSFSGDVTNEKDMMGVGWIAKDCLSLTFYLFETRTERDEWDGGIMDFRKATTENKGLKIQIGLVF